MFSQEELSRLLGERGFAVTQPTLSRDLRELGIVKGPAGYVPAAEIGVHGAAADAAPEDETAKADALLDRVLREFAVSADVAGTLVVVRTVVAGSHPVAQALDDRGLPGVAGTIAGEDTVFVAVKSADLARSVAERVLAVLNPSARPAPSPRPARPSRRPRAA